jgi:ATP-dependent Clp protease ATP-binding subunit ClpA
VLAQPHCVLLFDEIEKADPRVLDLFLAPLDEGRLTDGHGRTADFRDTIAAFISNAGASQIAEAQRAGALPSTAEVRAHFEQAVADRLSLPRDKGGIDRPELYGRLRSSILAFDTLRPEVIDAIAGKHLRQWREKHYFDHALTAKHAPVAAAVVTTPHEQGVQDRPEFTSGWGQLIEVAAMIVRVGGCARGSRSQQALQAGRRGPPWAHPSELGSQ